MKKELMKDLMHLIWEQYEYASILATDSTGKTYQVSGSGTSVYKNPLYCAMGYVLKVYNGKRYAEYSFNELKKEKFPHILEQIRLLFVADQSLDAHNINHYQRLEDEVIKSFTCNQPQSDPEVIGDDAIISRIKEIRAAGLHTDSRILDCMVKSNYQIYDKYFLSPNKEMAQKVLWMTGAFSMMAKKDEVIKSYYRGYSSLDGVSVLDQIYKDLDQSAKNTIALLDADQITPGEYECICTPEVTGMIAHEAFGHGVEMDMFVKDRALAKNYIGQYVASPLVTMHDGAAVKHKEVATYDFDDEGNTAKDTVIIEKGVLKRGISDMQTALALGTAPTGNGRRESYERKAYTRMTNTYFEGGHDRYEDMVASIKYGFLLENATCGMEDPKNWGIQCMVNMAREIKDGKFTGKIYSPIVLSGYVPDLLKSITMMSEREELCGSGMCGKGYKEWVKVSDGGPYIKAKIRLG